MTTPVAPTLRRIPTNGVVLALHDWGGAGRPVLLVHGNSFLGRLWDLTAHALLPDYRPLALDLRGHGESEVPPEGYRRQDHAADILGVVAALELERPFVLGHSLGAIATLLAAGMQPQRFGPLVLIEPVIRPKVRPEGWLPTGRLDQLVEQARRRRHRWPSREAAIAAYRTRPAFASWRPEVLALYVEHGFRETPSGEIELKCPGWVEAFGYEVTPSTDPWPLVTQVTAPVLVVRGERSTVFSAAIAADLVATLPCGRLITVPDRSHALPMEEPELVASLARAFFAEWSAARA
ncbi:MAG: alpha/beta hydrolase [Dehalococcoidia bacterium]|nr:MAG: alpha/beta hydrolase [Dehalococcoidia bacterium]